MYYTSKRPVIFKQTIKQKTNYQKQYETKIFKSTIVFLGFLMLDMGSWPLEQCQYWGASCELCLHPLK